MRRSERLPGFDGLRAVAALAVFTYHVDFFAAGLADSLGHRLLQQLRVGVWVFFALSGFLLYRPWAAAHLDGAKRPDLRSYLRNRALRILPAYWACLTFFVFVSRAGLTFESPVGVLARQYGLVQIYARSDAGLGTFRGLPHTWSLAVELSFYVALPLYAALVGAVVRRRPGRAFAVEVGGIAVLVAQWVAWTVATDGDAVRQQWLPNFSMAFGVGMLLAVLTTERGAATAVARILRSVARPALLWPAAAVALVVRSRFEIRAENGLGSQVLYALAAVALVAPFALAGERAGDSAIGRVLGHRVVVWLGTVSYGIFLWHYHIVAIARDDWLDAPSGWNGEVTLGVVALAATLVGAAASWYVVERPALAWRRRVAPVLAEWSDRRFRISLAAVTAAGFVWRVVYVLGQRGRQPLNGDAAYYHLQATAVARGIGFVDPFQWDQLGRIRQSAGHPPAYILYLAGFTKVGLGSETQHRLASCLLGAAAIAVIGFAGRAIAGNRVGVVAALAAAGYANLWINDEMLMSESMAALAFAFVVLAVYRYVAIPTRRRVLAAGAAIGFAALSRAELLALAVLIVVPLVWRCVGDRRERFVQIVGAGAVCALLVAPWVLYNVGRFEHPVLMSNGTGGVLLVGNCDETYHGELLGYWYVGCGGAAAVSLVGDESEREAIWREQGLTYLSDHVERFPVVAAARIGRMWDVYRPEQNISLNIALEGRGRSAPRLAFWQYVFLLPFAGAGLVALRRRRVPIWPLLATAGLITFTAVLAFGITRYRVPIDVALPILAAVGGVAWWSGEFGAARAPSARTSGPAQPARHSDTA